MNLAKKSVIGHAERLARLIRKLYKSQDDVLGTCRRADPAEGQPPTLKKVEFAHVKFARDQMITQIQPNTKRLGSKHVTP